MYEKRYIDWSRHISPLGRQILQNIGESPDYLPRDHNPITRALSENGVEFVKMVMDLKPQCKFSLSKLAVICQMNVYDAQDGVEGDGKLKALRRHWYAYYKTEFYQPFADALETINDNGKDEFDDILWVGRMSQTYAYFVDNCGLTYQDLWVEDASRMMQNTGDRLFPEANIIVAVEKDSLFGDFTEAAKALGAKSLYSGKGKSSKAAIEKLLREHYGWREDYDPFYDNPLVILSISDWDYDGEAVIAPTFAEQARRYTDNIIEVRVGIYPENIEESGLRPQDKWYQIKMGNKAYEEWAKDKAMFMTECVSCGHQTPVMGAYHDLYCNECGGALGWVTLDEFTPYGFEVESLRTRDYYKLLVYSLLQALSYDYIIDRLRDACKANSWEAAYNLKDDILENNESYQELKKKLDEMKEIAEEFENRILNEFWEIGEPHEGDWKDHGDDPDEDEFIDHVHSARGWVEPWRPFSVSERTNLLKEWLEENETELIGDFENEVLVW